MEERGKGLDDHTEINFYLVNRDNFGFFVDVEVILCMPTPYRVLPGNSSPNYLCTVG